jgi:hypothetical protein
MSVVGDWARRGKKKFKAARPGKKAAIAMYQSITFY